MDKKLNLIMIITLLLIGCSDPVILECTNTTTIINNTILKEITKTEYINITSYDCPVVDAPATKEDNKKYLSCMYELVNLKKEMMFYNYSNNTAYIENIVIDTSKYKQDLEICENRTKKAKEVLNGFY